MPNLSYDQLRQKVAALEAKYKGVEDLMREIVTEAGLGSVNYPIVGSSLSARVLELSLDGPAEEVTKGQIAWNDADQTFDMGINGGLTVLQAGQELGWFVRNDTASTIPDGVALMVTGTIGASGRMTVEPMVADGSVPSKFFLGLATSPIPAGADAFITAFGKVRGVDTSAYAEGAVLYCDPAVPGGLTDVLPEAPNLKLAAAFVVTVHAQVGTLATRVETGLKIDELHNVHIENLLNDQHIKYNLSTLRWENQTQLAPVVLSEYTEVPSRDAEENLHGALTPLATGHNLSVGDLTLTGATAQGIGKIVIVVNAGSDFTGTITVTGTKVDRETGVETPSAIDTLTIDALSLDTSSVDTNGQDQHQLTGAYITTDWYTGTVVISSSDTTITDIDVWHCSFEQFNDSPTVNIETFDMNFLCTNSTLASLSARLYTVEVTGDKVDIDYIAEYVEATFVAGRYYRIRRGNLGISLNGTTDGIFLTAAYLGAPSKFADAGTKIWAMISQS